MKNKLLSFMLLCTITQQTYSCHTAAAVAGAAIGGLAGGFILGRLIGRHDNDPAFFDYKEKQRLQFQAEKQKKEHKAQINAYQKKLDNLIKKKKDNSKTGQNYKDEIKKHESAIVSIDQDIRNYFKDDNSHNEPYKKKHKRFKN